MKMTRTGDVAKRLFDGKNRLSTLLGVAGWACLALGVVLFSFGLWTNSHSAGGQSVATYKDDAVYVTASYGDDAQIPENAQLRACPVTPEGNPDGYSQKMAAALAAAGGSDADVSANAIYNVGFYVGDREVEPAAPVDVTLQVLRGGAAAGAPVKVVHLGAGDAEIIADTSVDDGGFVSFTTNGFSDFAFIFSAADGSATMDDFIVSADLLDKDGKKLGPDDKIVLGEKYIYKVRFEENGDLQFTTPMTFRLPEGFVASTTGRQPIKNGDEVVGYYYVDETGLVTFEMDQKYLDEHGNVWVETTFNMTAVGTAEGEGTDFPWTGGEPQHFDMEGNPEVQLNKKAGEYDPVEHTIDYTLTLEVKSGSVLDPKIIDEMGKGVSLYGGSDEYTLKIYDENNNDITPTPAPTLKKTADGWETNGLPPLAKGQRVEVTYKAAVEFDDEGAAIEMGEGETRYHFGVDNTARVECDAPGEGTEVKGTKSVVEHKTVDDKQLEKDGTQAAGDTIDWEITVGSGEYDVRGTELTDTIGPGQWVDTSKKLEIKWKSSGPYSFTMKTKEIEWVFEADGKTVDREAMAAQGVTDIVDDGNGHITSFHVTIPDKTDDFWSKDINPGKLPEGHAQAWEKGDWVKVEYYTKYDPPADGTSIPYTNHVSGLTDIVPDGVTGQVVVGSGGIQKNLMDDSYGAGKDDYVEYELTVKAPPMDELLSMYSGTKNAGESYSGSIYPYFFIQDQLEFPSVSSYDENGAEVKTRYFVDNYPDIIGVEAFGETSGELEFSELAEPKYDGSGNPAGPYTYTFVHESQTHKDTREFQVWFNADLGKKDKGDYHNSLWPINEEVTLTIKYRVKGDSGIVKEVEKEDGSVVYEKTGMTLRDLVEAGNRLDNEVWAKFRYDDGKELHSENKYTKTPSDVNINKQAQLLDDNVIEYNVRFDNSYEDAADVEHHLHLFTQDEIDSFVFSDVFDSRLEYVPGSLQVFVYDVDGGMRGYYKVGDEDNIVITPDGSTTKMEVAASAFDDMTNTGSGKPTESGVYEMESLSEWLSTYQLEGGKHKPKDSNYVFYYRLRLKDEYLKAEDLVLDNTAHVTYGDTDLQDTARVETTPEVLDKFSDQVMSGKLGTNEVEYTIEVNPGAVNLAVGKAENGEAYDLPRYSLTDTMTKGMILDWNSIKVVGSYKENGKVVTRELTRVDDDADVDVGTFTYTVVPAGENGVKFVVPDEVKLTITYKVTLNREIMGMDPHGVNTVQLDGGISLSDQDDTIYHVELDSAQTGAADSIWLCKMDADTDHLIDGAEFMLYTKSGEGGKSVSLKADGETAKLTDSGQIYSPTSKADGSGRPGITILRPEGAEASDYYVLIETKAPDGYELDPTPIVFRFGKAPSTGAETVTVKVGNKSYDVTVKYYVSGDNVIVDNTPIRYALPESGGVGYLTVVAAGLVLVAGSGAILFIRRKLRRAQ